MKSLIKRNLLGTGVLAGLLLTAGCGEWVQYEEEPAAPPVEPPQVVTPGADTVDEDTRETYASLTRLEHLIFEGLLAQYIVDDGNGYTFVDYAGLESRPESRALLDQYLAILDLVDPAQLESSAERQAYWYNAYNAATLRGVLDLWEGNPEWSVAEGFFAFFDFEIWSFGGVVMSLNQLEHGVLRGDFDHDRLADLPAERIEALRERFEDVWDGGELDPRLHMAINCASYSCPNLAATAPYAFRAETLETQLERLVGEFLANPIKGAGPDGISSLFNWFAEDWSLGGYDGPADFIAKHREGGTAGVDLDTFLVYDWTLNLVPQTTE